jgi:hypothetical protein
VSEPPKPKEPHNHCILNYAHGSASRATLKATHKSILHLQGSLRGSVNRRVANVTTVAQEAIQSFGELSGKKSSQPIDGSSKSGSRVELRSRQCIRQVCAPAPPRRTALHVNPTSSIKPSQPGLHAGTSRCEDNRATSRSAGSVTCTTVGVSIFCSLELASFTYRSKLMYNPAQDTIAI